MDYLLTLPLAIIAAGLYMLHRNNRVYRFRMELIGQISAAARRDLAKPWGWRYAAYEEVSYAEMVLRFWKPLRPEAWYADTSFLRGGAR